MYSKPYRTPVLLVMAGAGLFSSLVRSPTFQAYRTFDIVGLMLVGLCFGYAAASVADIRRRFADRR